MRPPKNEQEVTIWRRLVSVAVSRFGEKQAATTLGTVTGKVEVFDAQGNSLGFIALYNSIT